MAHDQQVSEEERRVATKTANFERADLSFAFSFSFDPRRKEVDKSRSRSYRMT